ncbi:C4-dicarboxylate transporter, DctM subunit [Dethiosulfatibacter aminovorans DSM 17477]|uniref:C4-dicarboxylate transporter, DctM subunit n=1 Tax=Dethiosulfatibacter aminovorans DSM 17477 TaxID=1121476 RepID=A0A1M6AIU5_9FIRM|nr:TRAP transporter large permease [Dethiosulfatibacter aminovorans]SHI36404.1 C4-dicarboxylate transporter, DctM subunit [Dethiosulfatibacter aminovorans DSM 17477]
MSPSIVFIVFAISILVSIPVATTLGIVAVLPGILDSSFPASGEFIVRSMVGGVNSFPILAIPMFILSGMIMAQGGISKKLFNIFSYISGTKTAGIPIAVITTCLFYGAISGSAPATTAAVGAMTIPLLVELGYDKTFSTALVAVSGGLGVIIPPSIPFILYGMASGVSVGSMFIAGVLPGLLIGFCLMIYSYYYCKKNGEDKEKIEANFMKLKNKGFINVFKDSFWALLAPIIILGSIYGGIASPTEAATISVFYALFVSLFIYKTITFSKVKGIMVESVKTYTPLLFILAAAVGFSRVLALMQVPQLVSGFITGIFSGKVAILLIINLLLLFVGMIIDTGPALLILTPILLPITNAIGVNPIQLGIIMVVNLAVGFVTPPVGLNLFVASSITDIEVMDIAKKAMPFIAFFIVALLLITFIEEISLALL